VNVAVFLDARGPDPTGTSGLRRSFRAAGKLRMRMFRSQMRQAVVEHDVLGLAGGGLALQPPETRLRAFNGWARTAADQTLQGPWLSEWVARAWASGEAVGAQQTRSRQAPGEGSGAWAELAKVELESIASAVVQALTREAAIALTKRRSNKVMTWRRMAKGFDKIGPRRVMALANTFCVACHNRGRLAAYRAAGITKVGVIAEKLLPKQSLLLPGGLGDASAQTSRHREVLDAKHKGYREKKPAKSVAELPEAEGGIEVGVRTAEDEFVCIECDAFAANSPHDIDDVEDTLPIHPNCRCTWYPWDDRRFRRDAVDPHEVAKRVRARAMAQLMPEKYAAEECKAEHFAEAEIELGEVGEEFFAMWNERIGMEPSEFKQAFLGGADATMSIKAGRGTLTITGEFAEVGRYERILDMDGKEARHEYLELTVAAKAVGRQIIAGNIAMYRQIGIDKVTLLANIDVGGFAWAKYGFVPTPDAWSELLGDLRDRVEQLPKTHESDTSMLKALTKGKDPRAIWAVADSEYGEYLLLGAQWEGELDLTNKSATARFDGYFGAEDAAG
jgi:hypothetical protein